mgnify:CR=1 FL=1
MFLTTYCLLLVFPDAKFRGYTFRLNFIILCLFMMCPEHIHLNILKHLGGVLSSSPTKEHSIVITKLLLNVRETQIWAEFKCISS